MLWALIRKDARLLRIYLRSAAATTVACYLFMGVLATILTTYQDPAMQAATTRALMILAGGSNFGFSATAFFAALLAGSVFTLERSDRSAEFLACLPPTRLQNLASKLAVVLGTVGAMIVVHLLTNLVAHQIVPFVPAGSFARNGLADALGLLIFCAVIVSMVGGAFVVSASLNSNGVPVLCGLLTPLLVLSLISLVGWALEVPSEGDAFQLRFATSSMVLGTIFAYIGCYWYLTRSEP
ncbi:MAG: hypothetical protein SFV81_08110 [Pirellulaceae bacterium]|nr:hypothetical protein [Pirellulaceae bacterium]